MKLELAKQNQAYGRSKQAATLYSQVLAAEPDNVEANFGQATLYLSLKREGLARPFLQKVVELDPGHFNGRLKLASVLFDFGETENLLAVLNPVLEQTGHDVDKLIKLAVVYEKVAQRELAKSVYLKALEFDANRFEIHNNLGAIYRDTGQLESALHHFTRAVTLNPECGQAHFSIASIKRNTEGSQEILQMEQLYMASDHLESSQKMFLMYGLGKAYEDSGQFDKAFDLFLAANEMEASMRPYCAERSAKKFHDTKQFFSKNFFLDHAKIGSLSDCPIFIVGMPRSGTSLVEQILASHRQVFGAGELDDLNNLAFRIQQLTQKSFPQGIEFVASELLSKMAERYLTKIQALSNGAEHVTDKMPQNFFYVGLITLLFPNAKIIHCKRNPMDTCLSIFKTSFSGSHAYSHDLANMGRYYLEYQELMRHWHSVLPFRIYDVEYEELVSNTEEEIGALLNFCQLPFDSHCLQFHKTDRTVATASAAQVRRPISNKSVAGWLRYEQQMQPFVAALETLRTSSHVDAASTM